MTHAVDIRARSWKYGSFLATCSFFWALYIYILTCLEPRLLYFAKTLAMPSGRTIDFPLFLKGSEFFGEFLARPGGISEYVAAWCSQYFYYAHGGPMILTTITFLAFLSTCCLIRGICKTRRAHFCFIPPLLLLAAFNRYTFRTAHFVSLLVVLMTASIYVLVAGRLKHGFTRGLVVLVASAVLYFVAGRVFSLFFILCVLHEIMIRCRTCTTAPRTNANDHRQLKGARLRALCTVTVIAIAGLSIALGTLDWDARRVLRANYLARNGMWEDFLGEIDRHPSQQYPASVMMDINRALYETGQLGNRMFSYRQFPGLLFELGARATSFNGACDILLQLGCVNQAEHAALEALEIHGERPGTLRRLAAICLVKNRPEAARIFLGTLSRDVIHGKWARDRLRQQEATELLSSDPEIQRLRSVMPLSDTVVTGEAENIKETLLLALLARNPKNDMAMEYLLAHYLLTRRPSKVACTFDHLNTAGHPTTPHHYAEALLLHNYRFDAQQIPGGATIPQNTADMTREAIHAVSECNGDRSAIARVMEARFPDSYCRYLFIGQGGGE